MLYGQIQAILSHVRYRPHQGFLAYPMTMAAIPNDYKTYVVLKFKP